MKTEFRKSAEILSCIILAILLTNMIVLLMPHNYNYTIYKYIFNANFVVSGIIVVYSVSKSIIIFMKIRNHNTNLELRDEFEDEIYAIVKVKNLMEGTKYTTYDIPKEILLDAIDKDIYKYDNFTFTAIYFLMCVFFFGYSVHINDTEYVYIISSIVVMNIISLLTNEYSKRKLYKIYSGMES